jgi:uncharacterized membrane protein YbhN (UPF0104 family)
VGEAMSGTRTTSKEMPDEFSPRRIRRRLLEFAGIGVLIGILVFVGPGLGSLRSHLRHASAGWLAAAVVLEVLSALSYVLVFRVVFCRRMSWKLSYQIGMAEQGANSVLSVSLGASQRRDEHRVHRPRDGRFLLPNQPGQRGHVVRLRRALCGGHP